MHESDLEIFAADQFGVQTDSFDRLWTPHRMAYVKAETPRGRDGESCPFCDAPSKSDQDGLIVHRGEKAYVLMNLFPYNTAHLLVCPYEHVSLYEDLTPQMRTEVAELTSHALEVLRSVIRPDGFNLGINQGEVAGAGIAAHLHQHIVPRWKGDANFFPVIAQTKAIPRLLEETREALQNAW
jgi:ATP adenylyltransferase